MKFKQVVGENLQYSVWWKVTGTNDAFQEYEYRDGFTFRDGYIEEYLLQDLPYSCRKYTVKVRVFNDQPCTLDSAEVYMYTQCPSPTITIQEETTCGSFKACWSKVPGDQV